MSQLNTKKVKFGDNIDLSKNFVLSVPAVSDGTFSLKREDGTIIWQVPPAGGNTISLNFNLDIAGNARRITGDFSNSSQSQRLLFQSNAVNGNTNVGAIPNGTGRRAQFSCFGTSDPANASVVTIVADESAGTCFISSSASGTGTFLPLSIQTGAMERFRLSATENRFQADFSNATVASRFMFQDSTANQTTEVGVLPNGTSTKAQINVYGSSDTVNHSVVRLGCDQTAGISYLNSGASGTGTVRPLVFQMGGVEKARIDSTGNTLFGKTAGDWTLDGWMFEYSSKSMIGTMTNSRSLALRRNGSDGAVLDFFKTGATVGSISVNATNTAYNTSSDYRLKENVEPIHRALERLSAIKPSTWKWKGQDTYGEGFIAHELAEVVPLAVTGEKDGEEMQQVDYAKLTPVLVAAVQELAKKVADLEGSS